MLSFPDSIWLLTAVRTPRRVFLFIRLTPYHTGTNERRTEGGRRGKGEVRTQEMMGMVGGYGLRFTKNPARRRRFAPHMSSPSPSALTFDCLVEPSFLHSPPCSCLPYRLAPFLPPYASPPLPRQPILPARFPSCSLQSATNRQ